MEGVKTFWLVNSVYDDVREFHFSSDVSSFVVYFKDDEPIFVIDNTCDIVSPNNLLIIEALPEERGEKNPKTKWDSILKNKYKIDPIKVRPKENTKYKKLDISYSDLSLYKKFAFSQTDDLFDSIMEKRELLSLDNAYERESENLLNYNKSTQTIEKANVSLENLKKKILHISKRLKHQNELESSNPEKVDEVLKAELVQKMYDNTEKLKRAERRIKRAKKRSVKSFEDLSVNRAQIQEIKNRINARNKNNAEESRILSKFNYSDSSENETDDKKYVKNQDVENRKIEELTIKNINANNEPREGLGTILSKKETVMAKETENKTLKTTTEFKPPFVDDTSVSKTNDKAVGKPVTFDDKYKKVWMYVASIMVSLIIVFGLFFLLSGDVEENYVNNSNYVEQNYQEAVVEQPAEEVAFEEETVSEPVQEEENVVSEESVPAPEPVVEKAPVPESKPVVKKEAPKPVKAKAPVEKKVTSVAKPKTIIEEEVILEEDALANIPEEDEDDSDEETEDDDVGVSDLEIAKKEYVDNVIAGDQYVSLISYLKNNFFTLDNEDKIKELEKMNHYWNNFRNATYDAYYESDYTLKSDIDYEEYANDEHLLRLFSNLYYDFYEHVINEFVMKYEYANSTATTLYAAIENELDVLGRPVAKLEILSKIYNAIKDQGGATAVLSAIAEKDETETVAADNMEIEASLVPLTATTEVVYQEKLYSDDNVDIVSQDSTEVVTDFAKEYAESDNVLPVSSESDDEEEVEVAVSESDSSSNNEDVEEVVDSEEDADEEDTEVATEETSDDEEVADSEEEDSEVATEDPAKLDVVEDVEEEVSSTSSGADEEELVLSTDDSSEEEGEGESSEDDEYYAEDDSSEDDVEYTDSESEIVVEEEA